MTRAERAQVVELLRCAADEAQHDPFPRLSAAYYLGIDTGSTVYQLACGACDWVGPVRDQHQLLEAAACVEEGSYP